MHGPKVSTFIWKVKNRAKKHCKTLKRPSCLTLYRKWPCSAPLGTLCVEQAWVKLQFEHIGMSVAACRFFSRHFLWIFRVKHSTSKKISYILLLSYRDVTPLKMLQISC